MTKTGHILQPYVPVHACKIRMEDLVYRYLLTAFPQGK